LDRIISNAPCAWGCGYRYCTTVGGRWCSMRGITIADQWVCHSDTGNGAWMKRKTVRSPPRLRHQTLFQWTQVQDADITMSSMQVTRDRSQISNNRSRRKDSKRRATRRKYASSSDEERVALTLTLPTSVYIDLLHTARTPRYRYL
jgi:hypothetical protein